MAMLTDMVRPMLTAAERERGVRLGTVLRAARGDRSTVEIAAASGIPAETLRKIESGRIPTPAFFTVVALADALGITLAEIAAVEFPGSTGDADAQVRSA